VHGAGLAFTGLAAVFWAAYIVLAQRAGQRFRGSEGVAMAMAVAAGVALLPACFEVDSTALEPSVLLLGAGAGLLLVIPYSLEAETLRRMPRRVFGVLMSLEPAAAALAGWIVLGQMLDARALVAIALVVIAGAGAVASVTETEAVPDPLAGPVRCEPS
jgi:inner membrane transporter RhtA